MKAIFCDRCAREMADDTSDLSVKMRAKRDKEILVEYSVVYRTVPGHKDGEFCRYCILEAIAGLDDRPEVKA